MNICNDISYENSVWDSLYSFGFYMSRDHVRNFHFHEKVRKGGLLTGRAFNELIEIELNNFQARVNLEHTLKLV